MSQALAIPSILLADSAFLLPVSKFVQQTMMLFLFANIIFGKRRLLLLPTDRHSALQLQQTSLGIPCLLSFESLRIQASDLAWNAHTCSNEAMRLLFTAIMPPIPHLCHADLMYYCVGRSQENESGVFRIHKIRMNQMK